MRASASTSLSGARWASHRRSGQLLAATTNPSVIFSPSRRLFTSSALHALSLDNVQRSHDTIKTVETLSRRPQPLGALSIRLRRSKNKPPTSTSTSAAAATTSSDAATTTSSSAPRRTAGRAASLGDPQAKPAPRGAAARRAKEEATAAAGSEDEDKPFKGRGRGQRSTTTTSKWGSAPGRGPGRSSSAPVPRGASASQLAKRAPSWMRLDEAEIERQRAELAADRAAKEIDGDSDVIARREPMRSASSLARARLAKTEHVGSTKRALEAARKLEQEGREARRLMSREGGTKPDFSAHAHPTREQWWAVEVPCSDARKASSVARWLEAAPRRIPKLGVDESIERVVSCYVPKKQVRAWSFRASKMGSRKVAFRDGAVVLFRAIMDQHLGEYIASSIIDVSSYDERKETAGRISGYHKKIMFPGSQKNQVPLPLCFADAGQGGESESELLQEAREWEVTEEIWDRATSWEHENPGTPLPPLPSDEDAPGAVLDLGAGAGKGAGLAAARAELAKAAQQQQQREKEKEQQASSYLPAVRGRARETLEKAAYSEEARLAGFAKRVAEASRAAEAASAAAAGWNVGPPPPSSQGRDRFYDGDGGFGSGERGERKEYAPRGGARGRGGVSSRRAEPTQTPRFGSNRGGGGGGGWASNNGEQDDEGDGRFRSSSSSYNDDDGAFGVGGAWGDATGGEGAAAAATGDESDGFGWRPSSTSDAAAGSWLDDDDGYFSRSSKSKPSRKSEKAVDPIAATASRDAGSSADEDAWASEDGTTLAGEFLKESSSSSSNFDAGAVAARDFFESAAASDGAEGSWATSGARESSDSDFDGQDPSSWFDEGLEWE